MANRKNGRRSLVRNLVVAMSLAGVLGAAGFSPSSVASAQTAKTRFNKQQIAEKLKFCVCWLRGSKRGGIYSGTGWVLDAKKRLIVTNFHVVDGMTGIKAYFPYKKKDGEWANEYDDYLKNAKPITAVVIDSDRVTDLALLQLDDLPTTAVALKLAEKSAPQGSQLHSIGGYTYGSSALWTYTFGHVRLVAKGRTALNETTRIVECQMEYNKGNSGGPIVNDEFELVAVVEGYRIARKSGGVVYNVRNVSIAIDVKQLQSWLKGTLPLIDPKTAEDFLRRGKRYLDSFKYNDAIKDFSKAISLNDKLTAAYVQRGLAFSKKGDYRTALSDIDDALKKDPNNADAYYARSEINKGLKKNKEAVADLTNAIRAAPGSWKYYYYRGRLLYDDAKYRDAYDDFQRASRNDRNQYLPHYWRGSAALRLKLNYTAASAFGEAIRVDPNSANAHNDQGVAYHNLKEYKKAAEKFRDAIKVRPTYYLYHANLGLALTDLKDYNAAISEFNTAIKGYPKAKYYHNRGRAKHYLRNYSGAISDYSTAIKKSISVPSYYYTDRGLAYHYTGKYDSAIADFTSAIAKDKNNASLYYYRGRSYKSKGFTFSSSRDYKRAAELDPKKYGYLVKNRSSSGTINKF